MGQDNSVQFIGKPSTPEEREERFANAQNGRPVTTEINLDKMGQPMEDDTVVNFTKHALMELQRVSWANLDFRKGSNVTAHLGVLAEMAKVAQKGIELRQASDTGGAVVGAANMLAELFKNVSPSQESPLVREKPDPTIEAPVIEDDETFETVPGETDVGTHNVQEDDFLK